MFRVGQKVVCIKAHSQDIITVGRIYTVKGTRISKCCNTDMIAKGKE